MQQASPDALRVHVLQMQARNWTGSKIVGGLSKLDRQLEKAEILKPISDESPKEIENQLPKDCQEVATSLSLTTLICADALLWLKPPFISCLGFGSETLLSIIISILGSSSQAEPLTMP